MILGSDGRPYDVNRGKCYHGVTFDSVEANRLLDYWVPNTNEDAAMQFIMGNPMAAEVRKRWPRLDGLCPLGCGYVGIAYASQEHYLAGDW